jgi:hypothetical protein
MEYWDCSCAEERKDNSGSGSSRPELMIFATPFCTMPTVFDIAGGGEHLGIGCYDVGFASLSVTVEI